jgi:hypothetical protein
VSTGSSIGKAIVALATLAVAGATLVLGVAAQVGSASASSNCVAVVVDFRLLGGSVQTGCAQGDPSTGLQALTSAGFGFTPRPRDGLICQINARPACADTTTTKYWSYWYRGAGSSRWVYASEGPATHNPKPGSTEGWVWQDGGRTPPPATRAETICPQLAATASPKPTTTTTKPTRKPTPASALPTSGKTHAPASTPAKTGSRSAGRSSPSATADPPSDSPTNGSGTPSSTSAAVAQSTDGSTTGAAASDPADQGGGGALGGAAGVALGSAVVLGIGAATVVRARRGRSP